MRARINPAFNVDNFSYRALIDYPVVILGPSSSTTVSPHHFHVYPPPPSPQRRHLTDEIEDIL